MFGSGTAIIIDPRFSLSAPEKPRLERGFFVDDLKVGG